MPFPLPDWIYAVDLEAYIAGGDSDGEHPSPTMSSASLEADEDFMDPRTFIRPSTPLFGFHNSEDDEDDETSEKITRNGENDGHDAHGVAETPAAGGQFQRENVKEHHRQSAFTDLKLVPFVDEREIDSLFAGDGRAKDFHYHSNGLYFLENSEGDDEEEAAGSTEDDESTLVGSEEESSESIYVCNKVELGQGRVPVTFIPYKEEWITHRVYDRMMDQMSSSRCFYFPEPLFTLSRPLKPCKPHRRKVSAVGRKQSSLRVRVLTNSLQVQAITDKLKLLNPQLAQPPDPETPTWTRPSRIKPDLYLTPVELKALKSTIELEMI